MKLTRESRISSIFKLAMELRYTFMEHIRILIPFCIMQPYSKLSIIIFINRTIYRTGHKVYLLHSIISKRMIWMIGSKLLQHHLKSILTVTISIVWISLELLLQSCEKLHTWSSKDAAPSYFFNNDNRDVE